MRDGEKHYKCSGCGECKPVIDYHITRGLPASKCKSCISLKKKNQYRKRTGQTIYQESRGISKNKESTLKKAEARFMEIVNSKSILQNINEFQKLTEIINSY